MSLSRLVFRAGCGIRLYRFLIIAFLATLNMAKTNTSGAFRTISIIQYISSAGILLLSIKRVFPSSDRRLRGDPIVLDCPQIPNDEYHPILREEVEAADKALKMGKSAGVDNIPA